MRQIMIILSILFLVSCNSEQKPLDENFNTICFINDTYEIEVGNGAYMNIPKIQYVLFIYHDTIFQVSIENEKSTYSFMKLRNKGKDSLQSIFKEYDKTYLKKQLKSMKENNYHGTCAPNGYFLSRNDEKLNFGIFFYRDYSNWIRRYSHKEIQLKPAQFPQIYQTIYHTLNSKQWDYVMSDEYYYKDIRTANRHITFLENHADS